jgi:hypothetical protein
LPKFRNRTFFEDYSCENRSAFRFEWTEFHNAACMLGMRAFGIINVDKIKEHFALFRGIDESTIYRHCHTLLGCSSIKMINESKVHCDPVKIQAYFYNIMNLRKTDKALAARFPVSDGKIVNSYPTT